MMMTSEERLKTLEIHKLTHLREKGRFVLFRRAKKRNGSVSGERTGSLYNIMRVVLALTIGIMPAASSCLWLMLYQRRTSPRSLSHMR
jgi:RNase P/RNase MRP subunit POP5